MKLTKLAWKGLSPHLAVLLLVLPFTTEQHAMAQAPADKAWNVLQAGLADKSLEERAMAVRMLGLLEDDPKATELALKALGDGKAEVRIAAADALGQMNAKSAAPKLADVILSGEKEVAVLLACARAMITLGDTRGFGVYYAILTGEKKSGGSLLDDQKKMLSDPKKMAQFGFEQGIGFIPFGGIGYAGFKMLTKDDESPVRAAAARILTKDPDPKSGQALVEATSNKSWIVRMAALDSLARRGDPTVIPQIVAKLHDDKDVVRYTAAGAIIRLSGPKTQVITQKKPQ
jgi:hypothetical protein